MHAHCLLRKLVAIMEQNIANKTSICSIIAWIESDSLLEYYHVSLRHAISSLDAPLIDPVFSDITFERLGKSVRAQDHRSVATQ